MGIRNVVRKTLINTAKGLEKLDKKLEPTPEAELTQMLQRGDIPTPILLEGLDTIKRRLVELEAEQNA